MEGRREVSLIPGLSITNGHGIVSVKEVTGNFNVITAISRRHLSLPIDATM